MSSKSTHEPKDVLTTQGGERQVLDYTHDSNEDEEIARQLVRNYPLHNTRLHEPGLRERFVIAGFGGLGRQIALKIVRLGHLTNGIPPELKIVDPEATSLSVPFLGRFPSLKIIADIVFFDLAFRSAEFLELTFLPDLDPDVRETLILAFDDDSLTAAVVPAMFAACARRGIDSIYVRLMDENVRERLQGRHSRVHLCPFGFRGSALNPGPLQIDQTDRLARAIHEEYLIQQQATEDPGNPCMVPWQLLPEEYRNACREQADHIHVKVKSLGCILIPASDSRCEPFNPSPGETESLARIEHSRWMTDRLLAGWQYGEIRDNNLKLHPSLIPYDDLSESEKEKDRDTVRNIPRLLHEAGLGIRQSGSGPGGKHDSSDL